MSSSGVREWHTPSPLDFAVEWQRAAEEAGGSRVLSRSIVRTMYMESPGSGTVDVLRLDDDALVNVVNCVPPRMARWAYLTDEPLIMLRASLACDVTFRYGGRSPMIFNRPEVVLACMPKGLPVTVDIAGGSRQQGIVGIFRSSSFAARYGLEGEDLPEEVRDALADEAAIGRIASFPVDHRVAALIADTLDTRLHGELRVVQVAGRVAELAAFALDAMWTQPHLRGTALHLRRDLDLAQAAMARLDRDYRRPPLFADLAKELGTNQNKLKAVFKEAFGITMADYCLERRVREAQLLLLEASLTIAQIAERVGYEHQSSFAAAFRDRVGMTPRAYRQHRAPLSLPLPARGVRE
ncbi:MAG: AraC family transcriptional regulator [Burkholderiales bacterium]|nr:AraC family transcriptional regulator [Burkholderiales bacterium]